MRTPRDRRAPGATSCAEMKWLRQFVLRTYEDRIRIGFVGLQRHPGFLNLRVGSPDSAFGNQNTFVALPSTAILVLDTTPVSYSMIKRRVRRAAGVISFLSGLDQSSWCSSCSSESLGIDVGSSTKHRSSYS